MANHPSRHHSQTLSVTSMSPRAIVYVQLSAMKIHLSIAVLFCFKIASSLRHDATSRLRMVLDKPVGAKRMVGNDRRDMSSNGALTGMVLYNTATKTNVTLINNMTIVSANPNFTVVAVLSGTTGIESVRFRQVQAGKSTVYTGIENIFLYTLCGNKGTNFTTCAFLKYGTHTVTATAFSMDDAKGNQVGPVVTLTFTILPPTAARAPTKAPTKVQAPTKAPTKAPAKQPTKAPTRAPTKQPTNAPTRAPAKQPTKAPTRAPAKQPTKVPTKAPTKAPTKMPTKPPMKASTKAPTNAPAKTSTKAPTKAPMKASAKPPTKAPMKAPTKAPTNVPTRAPTKAPTKAVTKAPTTAPTKAPMKPPTKAPTMAPNKVPTNVPTKTPTKGPTEGPTKVPTNMPTNAPDIVACGSNTSTLVEYINSITLSNQTLSLSGTTPLDKALQQLVTSNDDALVQLSTCFDADKKRLNQRFAYLAFAFSTGKGDTDWFTGPRECQWTGVTCNGNNEVARLNFHQTGLKGTIPDDVGLWTSLTFFGADRNDLAGSLPSSIGLWTSLLQFDVSLNFLSGSLPSTIGLWTRIFEFFVLSNQLTGSVPVDVSNWTSTKRAYIFDNMFNGTMPAFGNGFCPKRGNGEALFADCKSEIFCECCNQCF
jgi:hypothetical protein